jgi:NADH dehydrogenase FAD-containing subunit
MTQSGEVAARPTVAVIGGGYGGIAVARGLDDVADVTLVEQRDAFVHNIAALRALVEPSWLPRIFIPYSGLLANGRVIHDRAVEADVGRVVTASGTQINPDYLVLATGSTYPYPANADRHQSTNAIAHYRETHRDLTGAQRVLILGAGPVGLELAGEISSAWPEKTITILEPQNDVVSGPYKEELRDELRRQLAARGVELVLGTSLVADPPTPAGIHSPFSVRTTSGHTIDADIWFRCYGVKPVSDYLTGELAKARRPDGFIEVTPELRAAGQETVFALGDVSTIDRKMAARAARQAETIIANVRALMEGTAPQTYEPLPPVILIPLGPDGGAAQLPGRDDIAGAEVSAELKGNHMFVDRYREMLGLQPAATRP